MLKIPTYKPIKKGGDTDCPDCVVPVGGVEVNDTNYTKMVFGVLDRNLTQEELSWLSTHQTDAQKIYEFLSENNNSEEAKEFANLAIITYLDGSEFNLNSYDSFQNFIPDYKRRMSPEELTIFQSMQNIQQKRYLFNAYIASNKAIELFPNSEYGWHNDKADAFRHSYFHALNSYYISIEFSKLLGDAHEINTPSSLLLEKTMDLYNNEIGRNLSQSPPVIMNGYGVLQIRIQNAIINGDLVYISPIQPPNGGLLPNSILIPTNQ